MHIVDKHAAATLATALRSPNHQADAQAILGAWIIEQVTFEDEAREILAPFMWQDQASPPSQA